MRKEINRLAHHPVRQLRTFSLLNATKTWMLPVVLIAITIGACTNSAQTDQAAIDLSDATQYEGDPAKGRDFREISVHPNGQELLFTECVHDPKLYPDGYCWGLRYDIHSNQLKRYEFPKGYVYQHFRFSPNGEYVLMKRVPNIDGKNELVPQAFENSEIALMKADGTYFKVLPLSKGNKVAPIMSQDGTKVAYWRSSLRPPGSKSFSSKFDIWEVDLKTEQDKLFAGPFAFFERHSLQYLSQDEMLVGAYGPKEHAQSMFAYDKKYNNSAVYRIRRGSSTLPEPILTEVKWANNPSLDKAGNLYFTGERPVGVRGELIISPSRKTVQGELEQWKWPIRYASGESGGGPSDVVADPNGSYFAIIYAIKNTPWRDNKRGMGLLVTQTSEWRILNIPPLQSSTQIAVKTAN